MRLRGEEERVCLDSGREVVRDDLVDAVLVVDSGRNRRAFDVAALLTGVWVCVSLAVHQPFRSWRNVWTKVYQLRGITSLLANRKTGSIKLLGRSLKVCRISQSEWRRVAFVTGEIGLRADAPLWGAAVFRRLGVRVGAPASAREVRECAHVCMCVHVCK